MVTEIIILLVINVITFFTYGFDKWKAKHGKWRISEATLLLLAVFGGSIGAWLGMKAWHHKMLDQIPSFSPYASMVRETPLAIVVCGDLDKALAGRFPRHGGFGEKHRQYHPQPSIGAKGC